MKIYLAASYTRKREIAQVAARLRKCGFKVTSRWLREGLKMDMLHGALRDISDIRSCDVLVRFTDKLDRKMVPAQLATGARMFECGAAWVLGKVVMVIGGHQQIFDYLPNIVHLNDVDDLIIKLRGNGYASLQNRRNAR